MKKSGLIVLIISMFVFNTNIFALCEDKELNNQINSFKIDIIEDKDMYVKLEDSNEEVLFEAEYAYVLTFNPVSNDYRIRVTVDGATEDAKYSTKYKKYIYGSYIHFSPKEYLIEAYTDSYSVCPNEVLYTVKVKVPSYNEFSSSKYCEENNDEEICRVYYDISTKSDEEINDIIEKRQEEIDKENMTIFQKIMYFIKKSWIFVVLPILVITIAYIIKIVKYKKKVSRR